MPDEASLRRTLTKIRSEAEERDAKRRAAKAGIPYVDLSKVPISIEALRLVPEAEARRAQVAAIEVRPDRQEVAIALFDPDLKEAAQTIRALEAKQYTTKRFVASRAGLEQAWRMYKFTGTESKEITGKIAPEKQRIEDLLKKFKNIQAVHGEFEGANWKAFPTTQLFEIVLAGALANEASDIHLEAEEERAKLRYRLDGALHDVFDGIPFKNYEALVSRIKLLSGLKINIHTEPQDGRFTIDLSRKEIEVRVSIIPSEFGETIVMRVLDPDAIRVDLKDLGFRPDDLAIAEANLARPNGLVLNTGPTGSGKTTTLYAFLKKITNPEIKIITIEDPIEYRIEGVEQTQVDPEAGYAFASGLRSILRQDPDVILVGEIRDKETADIAVQAALTGHVVFSTLHTNDAVGAVPRLIDLGVKASSIAPALLLVIAQRLLRRLCPECKAPVALTEDLKRNIASFMQSLPKRVSRDPRPPALFEAKGCPRCNHAGYKGRIGIFELFEAGEEVAEVIQGGASESALLRLARGRGMVSMQQDGLLRALEGITTLDEVEKITGPIAWGNPKS